MTDIRQSGLVSKTYEPFLAFRRGAIELLAHFMMLSLILIAIKATEKLVQALWGVNEKRLLGVIPVAYLFEGADLALLVGFLTAGVVLVVRAYIRK